MANQIMVIHPYREHGTWVFDDPAVELKKEPFIAGVPELINILTSTIPNANSGFKLLFSSSAFPGYQFRLSRTISEHEGWWYLEEDLGMEGWLCPALFKYFKQAPKYIFVKAEPKE